MLMSLVGKITDWRKNLLPFLLILGTVVFFAGMVSVDPVRSDRPRRTAAIAQVAIFMTALSAYKQDTGTFPPNDIGLQALRVKQENAPNWAGPYLTKDIPMDPWGRPYLYKFPGEHGDEPDIVSLGADGQPGGEGNNADIVSWKNN
jgi:general secretion pathway protein G